MDEATTTTPETKEESSDHYLTIKSLIFTTIKSLLNAENKRIALNSIAATTTISILFVISLILYLVFYFVSMPNVKQSIDCYFDYSAQPLPVALIDFQQVSSIDGSIVWKSGQKYNLGFELEVPDSEANFNQGNFMITMELLGSKNNTLTTISKPAHLTYKSPLLRTLNTLVFSPFFLMGSSRESSRISLVLVENYLEKGGDVVQFARITLGNPNGLAYFMHHWWLSTALFFMSNFMLAEVLLASFVWNIMTADENSPAADSTDAHLQESVNEEQPSDNQAATLEEEKSPAPSSLENDNDVDTLDGESMVEDYHETEDQVQIEPQVLTGMLRGPSTTNSYPVSRGSSFANRHQLSQTGNFSYPYSSRNALERVSPAVVQLSRSLSPILSHSASVSGGYASSSNTSLPRSRGGSVVPDSTDDEDQGERTPDLDATITATVPDMSNTTASTIHAFGGDTVQEVEEEFDMSGLLEKEEDLLL